MCSSDKKPVIQMSLSGKFIDEYESIHLASRVTGIVRSNIIESINNKGRKSAGGFKWKLK